MLQTRNSESNIPQIMLPNMGKYEFGNNMIELLLPKCKQTKFWKQSNPNCVPKSEGKYKFANTTAKL